MVASPKQGKKACTAWRFERAFFFLQVRCIGEAMFMFSWELGGSCIRHRSGSWGDSNVLLADLQAEHWISSRQQEVHWKTACQIRFESRSVHWQTNRLFCFI